MSEAEGVLRQTHGEEQTAMQPQRQKLEQWVHKPWDAGSLRKLEEARNRFSPIVPRGSAASPDTWMSNFCLPEL